MAWEKQNLINLCNMIVGKTPSRSCPDYWGGTSRWAAISDLSSQFLAETREHITEKAIQECNCKLIPKDTLLMSFKLSIGKISITKTPLFTNEAIVALLIIDKEILDQRFLYHYLNSQDFSRLGDKAVKGLTLNQEKLKKIRLPIPPIKEQIRIAAILDSADTIRAKRKAAIAKLDEFAQSIFFDMFGDPVRNEKRWETKKLKSITSKIGSGSTPTGGDVSYKKEGISLIRSMNIYDNHFEFKNLAFIDEEQARKLNSVTIKKDDILLNITGASVCRCSMVPNDILPARVNQHVCIIRAIPDEIDPFFLQAVFISPKYKELLLMKARQNGATREALTKEQIENLAIISPPKNSQEKFTVKIDTLKSIKEKSMQISAREDALFASLQHRAFTGDL